MAKNESRGSSRRRENGDGSVFFRKSKGLWCAELTTEFDAQGRRKRRTIYGRTKAEVIAKMKEVEAAVTVGTYVPPSRLTVGAYLKDWLQVAAKPSLRITTFERYRGLIENHAIPTVGNAPLQALMPLQLQALYNQKLAEGLSPRSVQFLHTVIRKALSQAVKWGYVTQNAADAVDPPRPRKKELQVLDAEQVGIFLTAAKENTFYPLYVLAVTTGMRQGELLGLSWDDVDLDSKRVFIQRTLQEVNGQLVVGEVKTRSSRRMVTLPNIAATALDRHWQEQQRRGFADAPFVFTDVKGGPIRKQNLVRRSFKPLLRKAKLPDIRFHDLRHTHATLLLLKGVNPKLVQERLGHSSISITLDTYSHVLPNMQETVAHELDDLFDTLF